MFFPHGLEESSLHKLSLYLKLFYHTQWPTGIFKKNSGETPRTTFQLAVKLREILSSGKDTASGGLRGADWATTARGPQHLGTPIPKSAKKCNMRTIHNTL